MDNTYAALMIEQYRRKGLLVDTNLMLLMVIGRYDKNKIQRCKRTQKYSPAIFHLVDRVVTQFEIRFTTPNLFTEIDNLVRLDVFEREWPAIAWVMNNLIDDLREIPTPSAILTKHDLYEKIGLADCSILAGPDVLILTDDLPLTSFLTSQGRAVINLSHLITPA
jgi:hypothetical protein